MSHAYQVPSPLNSPFPLPQKNKVITQRQYREKEAECFNALRDVIKQLTGEELVTRVDANGFTLEAIDLLLPLPEIRMQEQAGPVIPPAPYEMSVTEVANLANTHPGYASHWPQPWQDVEFDAQNAYYTSSSQSHGQQYYPTSNVDSAFEQGGYHSFSENWPRNDPHF
ncbi:hypothetical protein JVT61DRAFT_15177 [Boletus reticuloceps]|uniref:Uncharacterized protein n=1 Tax=Boletus reticuloceps TaxID=495285 RepID=A0A8I2YSC5_9AGAM|nr:hypothetical protein JVT61DRAFT_15177 [Boletus reticuloceps]